MSGVLHHHLLMLKQMNKDNIPEIRELYAKLDVLGDKVKVLEDAVQTATSDIIPALVNFIDNSDMIFSDGAYNGASYSSNTSVLANWYGRSQSTTSSYTENGGSESSESIRASSHGSGARTGFEWDTGRGAILLTGGYRVATKLSSKLASAGNYMACRIQLTRAEGTSLGTGLKIKASLWDNTDNKILTGSLPELSSTKQGSHSGGTVTRQYILEVMLADGRFFYSDVSSFTTGQNQVVSSVVTTSVNSTNYVNIEIPKLIGASRYNLYRRTPSESDTSWYLVDSVPNSTNQISDYGGGVKTWTVPSFDNDHLQYSLAQAYIDDIDEQIPSTSTPYEIIIGLQVPTSFVINGNQFLQIEFVKNDYSNTTTTEIPADSIIIDKVGLSYTNGKWTPSSRDLTKIPTPTIPTDPIPSGGGGGSSSSGDSGVENPPAGGGRCVKEDTLILVWSDDGNHFYLPANSLVMGDRLVAWDGINFAPSKIKRIIKGFSRMNYKLSSREKELICSFTHRLIADFKDFEKGTRVGLLGSSTLIHENNSFVKGKLDGFECFSELISVISFVLEKGKHNYIANGFACHNLKPFEDGDYGIYSV